MQLYLALLPGFMVTEINRYQSLSDRKSKLLGRLMLLKYLREEKLEHLIHRWERDEYYKPFIAGWKAFNIAHSGDIAAFCISNEPVGLDIERILPIDVSMMAGHFCQEEVHYIVSSDKVLERFYEIWVKKEAVLKAAGIGIVNGLKDICCLQAEVYFKKRVWYFTSLDIDKRYTSYVCSPQSGMQPDPVTFDPRELLL